VCVRAQIQNIHTGAPKYDRCNNKRKKLPAYTRKNHGLPRYGVYISVTEWFVAPSERSHSGVSHQGSLFSNFFDRTAPTFLSFAPSEEV
jgi:hypothetical protein